ncbi:MAG: stage 0 sporulation protein [Thermodesulfobacteria bacterium]|nr:stage 0 sporulation protein [Thermodesulfobacteriota bacterium]
MGKERQRKNTKKEKKNKRPGFPEIVEVVLRDDYPGLHAEVKGLSLHPGDYVLLELPRPGRNAEEEETRVEVAKVVSPPMPLPIKPGLLPQVKRYATPKEVARLKENIEFEKKAWEICETLAREQGLEMKLVRVERLFDRSKVIFYYTAEGRIDFRQLVKDLVRALRTRIEMRQIGVRHEAGMIGGLGCCGREICCASFLKKFDPVSIKIAKEQSLPLDPTKISGICGRLLCCLLFEYDAYAELAASLPKVGKKVSTKKYQGRVVRYNIFRESVTLETSDGEEIEISVEDFRKEL